MFRSRRFRLSALFALLMTVFSLAAMDLAEARSGGSFGSRGTRTYQSIPSTQTVPGVTGPVQRSMNTPSTAGQQVFNTPRGGLFGGMGGWLLGGLLFSGLFGMMFGGGFGGIGGLFSLLIQGALIFLLVRWLFRRFGPQAASPGQGFGSGPSFGNSPPPQQAGPSPMSGFGFGAGARNTSEASRRAGNLDEVGIGDRDLAVFEQRLKQLQDAYSREEYDALRRITTPEVMSYLAEELAQAAAQGLRNEVFDVNLLQGDVAESWREGGSEYATIALRCDLP